MNSQSKKISAVAYITFQADLASKEGPVSPRLADLFFQLTQVREERTIEEWDALVVAAQTADDDVTIADVLEYGEEDEAA